MKNTKVKMEQTFADGTSDVSEMETAVIALEFEGDKLYIDYGYVKYTFETGKTHPYKYSSGGIELAFYITTDELSRVGDVFNVKYKIADSDGGFISENRLEMTIL